MQNNGQWVFGRSGGMCGQCREQKSHLPAVTVPDEARQPNTVAKVMQLDGNPGIHSHRRHLTVGKFDEHALDTQIESPAMTHGTLSTTNGNRKHLVELDRHPANGSPVPWRKGDRTQKSGNGWSRFGHNIRVQTEVPG
jgi:hypothetical protein